MEDLLEKEVVIDGQKIKYSLKLNEQENIFVFMHGWGSSYKLFSSIFTNLENYFAFDFPKNLSEIWVLNDYVEFTKKILNQKIPNIEQKKIIFVVHSFGGRVLVKMLNKYNFNVKQIICLGVPFVRDYGTREKSIYFLTKIFKFPISFLPKILNKKIRKIWYKIIGVDDYILLEDYIQKKTFQNIINEDIQKHSNILKKYKTDFIWGKCDKVASLDGARKISKKVGAKLHIIEKAEHFTFLEPYQKKFLEIFNKITK
ncbi:MAG: alpha/beta hydrolase [Candidatus Pacebacteria bacterium]|nr:alpha/beta hydrolase [Candidatus Paceibacterota bacterium]